LFLHNKATPVLKVHATVKNDGVLTIPNFEFFAVKFVSIQGIEA
jgi:hypothetical protein